MLGCSRGGFAKGGQIGDCKPQTPLTLRRDNMMSKTSAGRPKRKAEKKEERRLRLEAALQQGLEETFPASDAVAVIEPAPTPPDRDRA